MYLINNNFDAYDIYLCNKILNGIILIKVLIKFLKSWTERLSQ